MTTPSYFGEGQPSASMNDSWLGRLGSFFGGGGTPVYAGTGQPQATVASGMFGSASPAYLAPPMSEEQSAQQGAIAAEAPACGGEPLEPMLCPIDPAALAAGQIAIVIPRQEPQSQSQQ